MRNSGYGFQLYVTHTDKQGNEEKEAVRRVCFGSSLTSTYGRMLRSCSKVNFYWYNGVKAFGYEQYGQKFLDYVLDAFSKVEGAMYDFTVEFGPKSVPSNWEHKSEDTVKISIDPTKMGNITWFYFGSMMRNFSNVPRNIINFCRIAEMKFGDTTIIKHFGFHKTFMLAHILRMQKKEPDFCDGTCESGYFNHMSELYDIDLEHYLQNNLSALSAGDYRYNSNKKTVRLYDALVENPPKWLYNEGDGHGLYWDETMPTEVLTSLFKERKAA